MSLSDFSELTELSSDEDSMPLAAAARTRSKGGRDYQIRGSLRPPRTSQFSAKALYDQIIENTIDLDPEYQREIVWPETKQTGLIDSLLHNYYVPPIIFAVSSTDDGDEKRTCIDGKQRLTSIQRFMDGMIPHKDSFTNQKMWYKNAYGQNRKILPEQYKKLFANKQIVCVEYDNLSGDQEREIFQRVQLGVALTPAERMQAITGERPSLIRDIQMQVLGDNGFEGYLEWEHARGRDFQCITSIAYLIDKYPRQTTPGVAQLEKWLQDPNPVPKSHREGLLNTFRIFVSLARDKKLNTPFRKPTRVSPIEFVMIGLLIYLHAPTLSPTQLSSAIEMLRADVRAKFIDIRLNSKTMKHMYTFVTVKVKKLPLRSDGKGDLPAAEKAFTAKRKRVVDSDDEEPVAPRPRLAKGKSTAMSKSAPTKVSATSSPSKSLSVPSQQPTHLKSTVGKASALKTATSISHRASPAQVGPNSTKPNQSSSSNATELSKKPLPQRPSQSMATPRIPKISPPVAASKSVIGAGSKPVQPPPRGVSKPSKSPPSLVANSSASLSAPAQSSVVSPTVNAVTPPMPGNAIIPPAPIPSAPTLTSSAPASAHTHLCEPEFTPSAPAPFPPTPTLVSISPAAPLAHPNTVASVSVPSNNPPQPQASDVSAVDPAIKVKPEPQDTSLMSNHNQKHTGIQGIRDRLAPLRAARAAAHITKLEMQLPSLKPSPLIPSLVDTSRAQDAMEVTVPQGENIQGTSTLDVGTGAVSPQVKISQESIEALLVRTGLQKPLPVAQTQAQTPLQLNGSDNESINADHGGKGTASKSAEMVKPSRPGPLGVSTFWPNSQNPLHSSLGSSHKPNASVNSLTSGSNTSAQGRMAPPQAESQSQQLSVPSHLTVGLLASSQPSSQVAAPRPDDWGNESRSGIRPPQTPSGGSYSNLPPPSSAPPLRRPSFHDNTYTPRFDRIRRSSDGSYDHLDRERERDRDRNREHDRGHSVNGPRFGRGYSLSNVDSLRDDGRRDQREWGREKDWDMDYDRGRGGDRGRGRGGRGRGAGMRGRKKWEYP